jgi:hypothetical protein
MWYMKPIRVSVDVPDPREEVFAFLDVLGNHEQFTDHLLVDWECSGPERGVGARAHVRVRTGGRSEVIDMEVISADPPVTNTERSVGAGGRRVTTGTYVLEELPGGGTRITFELAWLKAPLSERLAGPLVRSLMRRENARAMRRLADLLAERRAVPQHT